MLLLQQNTQPAGVCDGTTNEPSVQICYRSSDTDLWQITWIEDLAQAIPPQSLGIEVPLQELYLKTENL